MSIRRSQRVVALALFVGVASAHATVVRGASVEELATTSALIVRGTVVAQQARWDEGRRRIDTFTEVRTTEVLRGDAGASILVRQPGGVVGDIGAHVAGAAKFAIGDEVVLFLETPPDDATVFIVRGLALGSVKLQQNALGEIRATRDLRGISIWTPERTPEAPVREIDAVEDLGLAERFLTRIRSALRKSSGGAR